VLNNDRCQPVLFLEPEEQRKEGAPPLRGKTKDEEMKHSIFSFVTDKFPERSEF
jgi:hypothetical protein